MSKVHIPVQPVPQHQADATLAQAAPVQNTWYNILATTANVRVYLIDVAVLTADETLQVRLVIDGVTYTATINATAANYYVFSMGKAGGTGAIDPILVAGDRSIFPYTYIEGRSVAVAMRKTTALGAGNLVGKVVYAKW